MTLEADNALRVMTFNVRRRFSALLQPRADRWWLRKHRLRELLQQHRPHLLGAQEALGGQGRWVRDSLGADFRSIGTGRSARGTGEACPILYDARRLELTDWRQIALSATPDVPGSRSWGNVIPRIAVVADFEDRCTGARFRHLNTHLDLLSSHARLHSAEQLRALATADNPLGSAILTGDFNAGPTSEPARILGQHDAMRDAWPAASARLTPEYRTFAGYAAPTPGRRIDWIYTTPDIAVDRISIISDPSRGGWASDHFPVLAEVQVPRPIRGS